MKKVFLIIFMGWLAQTQSAMNGCLPPSFRVVKLSEEQKIHMLIDYIKNLKDAVFIRNGSEHSSEEAAEHLAKKRKQAGNKVKTAVEFVVHVASKSSMTGKPYEIKFKDGKTVTSQQLLVDELKRIEKLNP